MFKPRNCSSGITSEAVKTLLYAHHGWGKTTQFQNMQERYGKGFLISLESGLLSIAGTDIDYVTINSYAGESDPENGVFSLVDICKLMLTPEFRSIGYKWIGVDSLTEIGDVVLSHYKEEHEGSKNGFALWGDYGDRMKGFLKFVRDYPAHVLVTALAKEETNDNGETEYWPLVNGQAVSKQIPGIFDNVLGGVRVTTGDRANPEVTRYVVTSEVKGWHGKVRDPHRTLKPVEKCDDITELFARVSKAISDKSSPYAED